MCAENKTFGLWSHVAFTVDRCVF